jgi:hypothetical protein
LTAAEALTGVQGTNIANAANTAQAGIRARQAGAQDMMRSTALQPEILDTRYTDAMRQREIGEYMQDRRDTNFADLRERRYQEQQAPYEQLEAYMGLTGMTPQAGISYQAGRDKINAQKPSGLQQTIGTVGMLGSALSGTGAGSAIGKTIGGIFGG